MVVVIDTLCDNTSFLKKKPHTLLIYIFGTDGNRETYSKIQMYGTNSSETTHFRTKMLTRDRFPGEPKRGIGNEAHTKWIYHITPLENRDGSP